MVYKTQSKTDTHCNVESYSRGPVSSAAIQETEEEKSAESVANYAGRSVRASSVSRECNPVPDQIFAPKPPKQFSAN